MKKTYIPTIGLEIHAELRTASKMFCACRNDPDERRSNWNVCPICLGHPGTLPVLNKAAIRHVVSVGRALGADIADYTEWDRKNYFYPDIPKGYQISQYKYPLVSGGALPLPDMGNRAVAIDTPPPGKAPSPEPVSPSADGAPTSRPQRPPRVSDEGLSRPAASIAITRIHLEEDTARSSHDAHEGSLVDFNRSGLPLMELVTEPVIHDAATAGAFARELQLLLRALGVAEANMEKGEMRVEANVSIATSEDTAAGKFGTKTEVKNLNSFRAVERAIAYEVERQSKLLEKGEAVTQETRGWDDAGQKTFSQRKKESSHDYRYFPDPDLPKLIVSEIPEFSADAMKKGMPELPWEKRERLIRDFSMTRKEAAMLVESLPVSAYFAAVIETVGDKPELRRLAVNYLLTDYIGLLKKAHDLEYEAKLGSIEPKRFAALIAMIGKGDLSSRGAKDVLAFLMKGDARTPAKIAEEEGLIQKSDEGAIKAIVAEVVKANPTVAADYKAGKAAALMFLVGQGMKASKGSANPELLKKLLIEAIG